MKLGILEAQNLSLVAGDKTLCSDLNFVLQPGELVGLLGRNGTGKTTLLRALAGLRIPNQGGVFFKEQNLKNLAAIQRATVISLLLATRSGDDSLQGAEFVAMGRWPFTPWHGGLSQRDKDLVRIAMEQTETLHLEKRHLNRLSDGEKQKLGLARVLAQQTQVILLDEPLSHLDAPSQIHMLDLLRRKTQEEKKSILFSCHDLNLAFHATQKLLVLLSEGKWFLGNPAEVFSHSGCRKQLGLDAATWLISSLPQAAPHFPEV